MDPTTQDYTTILVLTEKAGRNFFPSERSFSTPEVRQQLKYYV